MESPLVSIVVVTYNSEEYIIETLESVKSQTYKNLEIIISDDCSHDETLTKVEEWFLKNKERFLNYKIISSQKNTGISANLNRGVRASKGTYLKLLAGDDLLLPNCISDLYEFITNNDLLFCFSKPLPFIKTAREIDEKHLQNTIQNDHESYEAFFSKTQEEQFRAILRLNIPFSFIIGAFYSNQVYKKIGYYNEHYEMMEDYPFLFELSKAGYKFNFLDKYTCKYRIKPTTLDVNYKNSKRYVAHYKNLKNFRETSILPEMRKKRMFFSSVYFQILMFILSIEFNNRNKENNIHKFSKHLRTLKRKLFK
jgi:alpha-1,3-rhamnosyltransferase